jgi:hypothetical protein
VNTAAVLLTTVLTELPGSRPQYLSALDLSEFVPLSVESVVDDVLVPYLSTLTQDGEMTPEAAAAIGLLDRLVAADDPYLAAAVVRAHAAVRRHRRTATSLVAA